ncbi:lipopolysaccharide-induced tumor necrosis factor-alpha factor homolog [Teleopsis dalmanni]|uniref:lipopolysaccharide-induced tumor necrosis factor-alpha factor homolog n=1 Tax=Teleopsis dalmanni TaxID=139649 RepID=UPI0018CE719B|nr:lipopolysaccharide-induced tumor necrosis factor-alpha factor homolog [Teleopsis dalmanni]XP_037955912.1 lipopolysaccharide-induced tumor necrosis factor-alpha factor homolog [Teleopsis dalmanni]XP_037955913.1 lipopolysaccharide-induced tumor necrosis factor-alpha factor homolog [Teleopsis dalmanni]
MDKSTNNNFNYPKLPTQMETSTSSGQMPPAPPSYEQATGSTDISYPPVEILPTPNVNTLNTVPQERTMQTQTTTYTSINHQMPQYGSLGGATHTAHTYTTQQGAPPIIQQQPVVIIQQQAILPLGPEPVYLTCPACHIQKLTRIEYEPSSRTHLMAALLCVLGLWCCVCLPYCAGSCMNANHYCGNCNKFLGTYGATL